jgi:aspartate kinase
MSDEWRATTTLGFEGSDYTAAIVGAALDASDIQIWKDVPGLMTADPAVFAGARTVKLCSYAEAAELSYFGAKVLHPKAIYPAAQKNIPVHIYNSKRPEATGTAISAEVPACANLIKSIAYKRPIKVLNFHAGHDQGGGGREAPSDLILTLLAACAGQGVRPLLTASSASSVAFAVDADSLGEDRERNLLQEVSRFGSARVEADKAVISLVGKDLYRDTHIAGRVFKAIEDLRPEIILHGASPVMMNFVLAESQVADVIARLHGVLFEQLDPAIFE